MAEMENPGALWGATGLGHAFQARADGIPQVARQARKRKTGTPYSVTSEEGEAFEIEVSGRTRWALERLRAAGERGVTPVAEPGPRWSAYVHALRELGVEIETVREAHEGEFPGWHGRYVLRSRVERGRKGGAA